MQNPQVTSVAQSAFDSTTSLRSVVQAIPALEKSALNGQLLATLSLFSRLLQDSKLQSLVTPQPLKVLEHIGKYSRGIQERIQALFRIGSVDWATQKVHGRTIPEIAAFLQF